MLTVGRIDSWATIGQQVVYLAVIMTVLLQMFYEQGQPVPEPQDLDGPWVRRMAALARRARVTLLLGSLPERTPGESRVRNTSVLLGPDGATLAVYRKIHLFDVSIPDGARYAESETVVPGDEVVVAPTPLGAIGLSICYDLRFPELYRHLVLAGAQVLFVPSAFTAYTGRHHWTALLRARAIENLAYVLAPAQGGYHVSGRETHGDSMIVDPWGLVLVEGGEGEEIVTAEVDIREATRARAEFPALADRVLR